MKKMMVALIIVLPLVLGGVLYGTHSLIIEEKQAITLEQAYMAQYPQTMPDVMIDPMTTGRILKLNCFYGQLDMQVAVGSN